MTKKERKQDGRRSDLQFLWLLSTLGEQWLQWQQYAAEWMKQDEQQSGTSQKRSALILFF